MSGDDDYYAYPKDDIGGVLDFNGYQPNTTDPGLLLFLVTTSTVVLLMAIFVPCMVVRRKISRKRQKASQLDRATVVNRCEDASVTENDEGKRTSTEDSKADDNLYVQLEEQPASPDAPKSKSDRTTWENLRRKFISSIKSIVQLDKESRSILRYAGPFTFYAIAASVLSNVILALISWYIGTKEVVAYAVVSILVSLSEDFLKGPLYANTNLIARAIAVNNHFGGSICSTVVVVIFDGWRSLSCVLVLFHVRNCSFLDNRRREGGGIRPRLRQDLYLELCDRLHPSSHRATLGCYGSRNLHDIH